MAEFTTPEVEDSLEPHVRTRCSRNAHKLFGYSVDAERQRFSIKEIEASDLQNLRGVERRG
jgi:hypothetical protein